MSLRVDIAGSIAAANVALRRQPVLFAWPLVALGAASWAMTWFVDRFAEHLLSAVLLLLGSFLSLLFNYAILVAISAMFLRARTGARATLSEGLAVLRYPGLHGYLWELIGKYMAWGLVVGVPLVVLVIVVQALGAPPHSHQFLSADGWMGLAFIPILLIIAMVMSRYQFALPMFAILGGRHSHALMPETVRRAKLVWGVVLGIAVLEFVPGMIEIAVERWISPHWTGASHAVWRGGFKLLESLWVTWFVLLKTDVAIQVLEQEPMAAEPVAPGFIHDHPVAGLQG